MLLHPCIDRDSGSFGPYPPYEEACPIHGFLNIPRSAARVVYPRTFYTDLHGFKLLARFGEACPLAILGVY
jgi:hypothetical protein